jgi:multiple sugar transport system permease protein
MPNFIGFLLFTSLPVLASLCISFLEYDCITAPKFVGLKNFITLLGFHMESGMVAANDQEFWKYTWNTIFLMFAIPVGMLLSLATALAMNQKLKGIVLFRTVYFLPTVSSGVALALLWKWIYNPDFGLLNEFIGKIGALFYQSWRGPQWLSSIAWAKPSLMIMGLWTGMGGVNMILYLAALQGVPRDYYEAAEIDGASAWQKFCKITWPMISPTTFFIAIMSVIGGFQGGFMSAYVMTQGGPAGATTTIEYYIYNNAYQWFHMGYAASIAWFLFIVIFVVTLINWRFGGKLVQY